jgi:hypothetical protein
LVPEASGFTWEQRKSGEIVIRHHGQLAATLRGAKAERSSAVASDPSGAQALIARLTGNYKHGNERRHQK